jgi:hypothetical protein
VATMNDVSLQEFLCGFQTRYPSAPRTASLDLTQSDEFIKAVSRFSRVPAAVLRRMSLEQQVSAPERAFLLHFSASPVRDPRLLSQRLAYAFCPPCIALQNFVHVPWSWTFLSLLHCRDHDTHLIHGCPACGNPDPLPFGLSPATGRVPCWSCESNLLENTQKERRRTLPQVTALQRTYWAALTDKEPDPYPFGKVTSHQIRHFVDDTFRVLVKTQSPRWSLPRSSFHPAHSLPTHDLLETIAQLMLNAFADCDLYERRARYRRSLIRWTSILARLTPAERGHLARSSRSWPLAVRCRFDSAFAKVNRRESPSSLSTRSVWVLSARSAPDSSF